jgi:hypothetical protein
MNSLSIDDTATAATVIGRPAEQARLIAAARPEHCRTVRLVRRAA